MAASKAKEAGKSVLAAALGMLAVALLTAALGALLIVMGKGVSTDAKSMLGYAGVILAAILLSFSLVLIVTALRLSRRRISYQEGEVEEKENEKRQ